MDLRAEIMERLEGLPEDKLRCVLEFVHTLPSNGPIGTPGYKLLEFAGTLDDESAREMIAAIEEGCENINPNGW